MTADGKDEQEPFLADAEGRSDDAYDSQHSNSSWFKIHTIHFILLIAQAAFLALNVSLLVLNIHSPLQFAQHEIEEPYSPAHGIAQYDIQRLDLSATKSSPFFGEPRPELDEAWAKLTDSGMVQISADEMKKMNKSSIAIKDTDGYVGYYAVYHQLHCLKRMYQMMYKEYYSDIAHLHSFSMDHFQHCIEVLRQTLMCNADLTVNTIRWESRSSLEYVGVTTWDRKCIDWNTFHEWTNTKQIPAPLENFLVPKHEEGNFGP